MILANINHDLFVRSHDKVLVCPGELTREWGVDLLINALATLLEEQRSVKLWILGDSVERGRIYEALQFHSLHRIVIMPGAFTDVDQVLQAADMCLFPASGCGLGWLLPTCVASSIPVLAADSPELRGEFGPLADQICFRANDPRDLEVRVRRWIRNPKATELTVTAAREALVSQTDNGGASRTLATLLRARVLQTG
jgi:glycosyltransferase involved in cell wall biosynthesis